MAHSSMIGSSSGSERVRSNEQLTGSLHFNAGDAGDAAEVGNGDRVRESRRGKELRDRLGLVVAVLEEERAARREMAAGAGNDRADRIEAVGASVGERLSRLEAQVAVGEVRIAARDVRRVRDDQVEAAAGDRAVPRSGRELDAGVDAVGT